MKQVVIESPVINSPFKEPQVRDNLPHIISSPNNAGSKIVPGIYDEYRSIGVI